MLIKVRDRQGKLRAKDMLDLDFDMYVEKSEEKPGYQVIINPQYTLDGTFTKEADAENAMDALVDARNALEDELRREL